MYTWVIRLRKEDFFNMSKSVQDTNISKIYINMNDTVLENMDYITKHRTTYGLVKPSRKALIESLITREYDKILEGKKREIEWNQRLEDRGESYTDVEY